MGLSINNNYDYLKFLQAMQSGQISAADVLKNKGNESFLTLSNDSDSFEFSSSLEEMMEEISAYENELGINASEENAEIPEEVMESFQEIIAEEIEEVQEEIAADEATEANKGAENPAATEEAEDAKAAQEVAEEAAEVSDTEAASAASSTDATTLADGEESSKIKEEIEELEDSKDKNYKEMEKIEAEIEDLTARAEENIMKAAAAQEKKVEEHEEETQKAVEENINAYVEANKEGGKGMTRSELQGNIKGALSNVPEVGDAVSAAIAANDQLTAIDSKLGDLNELIADTQDIESKIDAKTQQYDACKKAEETAAEESKSCDPIGFTMGEGEDQVKYDFIVDDGAFDSTSDFLGAEDQWSEMQALDTDGDQIVTAAELEAGNIKAVKTDADGNQEVVSIAEELGEDFSIDLASYQEGGSHSAVQTGTDHDNDGTVDQELLGTFSMNVNGQSVQGYNTLDDTEWLEENYGLSAASTSAEEATENANAYSMELTTHVNFFQTYTQKVEDLKEQLKEAWVGIGQTEETLRALNGEAVEQADSEAKEVDETKAEEAVETETTEK